MRWQKLFADFKTQAQISNPTEIDLATVHQILGSVRLIQPFDWMKWQVAWPSIDEIPQLSLGDCVRHITRMVRSDRYADEEVGVIHRTTWQMLLNGELESLCRTAFLHTGGAIVPPFAEMEQAI
ncbi:MAG: hypothetical protein RIR69_1612 [Actinomycetota bacterium]